MADAVFALDLFFPLEIETSLAPSPPSNVVSLLVLAMAFLVNDIGTVLIGATVEEDDDDVDFLLNPLLRSLDVTLSPSLLLLLFDV